MQMKMSTKSHNLGRQVQLKHLPSPQLQDQVRPNKVSKHLSLQKARIDKGLSKPTIVKIDTPKRVLPKVPNPRDQSQHSPRLLQVSHEGAKVVRS